MFPDRDQLRVRATGVLVFRPRLLLPRCARRHGGRGYRDGRRRRLADDYHDDGNDQRHHDGHRTGRDQGEDAVPLAPGSYPGLPAMCVSR